jgi:hypothetical protein
MLQRYLCGLVPGCLKKIALCLLIFSEGSKFSRLLPRWKRTLARDVVHHSASSEDGTCFASSSQLNCLCHLTYDQTKDAAASRAADGNILGKGQAMDRPALTATTVCFAK